MENDINYKVLSLLTPKPTPEEIIKILVGFNFKSVAGLSRKILTSHTAINRVLAGENLPEVRREILSALEMTIDPFQQTLR
jgi:hypothetical protein